MTDYNKDNFHDEIFAMEWERIKNFRSQLRLHITQRLTSLTLVLEMANNMFALRSISGGQSYLSSPEHKWLWYTPAH